MEATQELNFIATLLPAAMIVFIIALGVLFLNQHFRKNLIQQKLQQEELKTRHQQELLRTSFHTQELERKRIAADLHDEMGAVLSIARMHLIQLEEEKAAPTALTGLQTVRTLTETALAALRRISHELMPPQLEMLGLVSTLRSIATTTNAANRVHLELIADPNLPELPWSARLGLYRVCLELINNTLKHSVATEIIVNLTCEDGVFIFAYSDNGQGITEPIKPGLGLANLEARVNAIGGTFIKQADRDTKGFHLTIAIKLTELSYA